MLGFLNGMRSTNSMQITKEIQMVDVGLYIPQQSCLILADPHLGYDEALNSKGVLVPRTHFKQTTARLEKILAQLPHLKKIIINGDLKHEFGTILPTEWRNTRRFVEFLKKYADEIVIIKGNHDVILGPLVRK